MQFLSADWLRAADAEVRATTFDPAKSVVIEQVVTDSPHGTVRYRLVVEAGAGHIEVPDDHDAPLADATITVTWDLARRIAAGTASAQQAFLHGELRLGGDVTALISHSDVATALSAALGTLSPDLDGS
ncbi:MAG TPA: SCP2 sterol-binding domain-containing protein [Microthrixaceae bacterium]|nr:SCP2 sterol-binding domain-containing protein [Microthrixaceae bacterium]